MATQTIVTSNSVPGSCQFCPEDVAVTVFQDYGDNATTNIDWFDPGPGDNDSPASDFHEIMLPAVLTASLQTTRETATTQKTSASGGAAVTVCAAASKADSFVVTGKYCHDYPIFGILPREEAFGGTPVERYFRVYLSASDVTASALFWEFSATYEYGNFDLDNNSTTGADWNVTLRVAGNMTEPLFEGTVAGATTGIFTDYTANGNP